MTSSNGIRKEYRDLESKFRWLRRNRVYEEAQEILQKMIELIDSQRGSFNEAEDRVRVLQARQFMMAYEAERLSGGESILGFLKEAASWSTPSICLDKPCPEFEPQICAHRVVLSPMQKSMCIQRFRYIANALKIEAAMAVPAFDYQRALENWRNAAKVAKAVAELTSNIGDLANQHYLEYWHCIAECNTSLHKAEFKLSKEWLAKALDTGKLLPFKRCFPNYFRDVPEIQAYETYIQAVEKVKSAKFGDAGALFQKWLNLNLGRAQEKDFRFDNIQVFEMVCDILDRLPKGDVNKADWDKVDQFMEEAYIARTTWALRSKLDWIREVSFRWKRGQLSTSEFDLITEVANLAQEWQLFIPDAVLLGEDRTAGLRRRAILPIFVDIFDRLEESEHNWQHLLYQNFKNCLLLMADYEYMRFCNPPLEERSLPRQEGFVKPSEKLDIPELVHVILAYFRRRRADKLNLFENTFNRYYPQFVSAIEANQFAQAIVAERRILEEMRIQPHIIQVERQRELPEPLFLDEENPNFLARETTCFRLWNNRPHKVVFEGPQNLEVGAYYYLRPRWNIRSNERYRIRHMDFLQSDTPRWISVFFENIFRRGEKESKRFRDWIIQFNDSERILACQLYDMLRVFDADNVRDMWLRIYRKKLPLKAKTKGVAYLSLGHTAKSGSLNNYYLRQAMSKLDSNEYSFEFKEAFQEISEFDRKQEKPHTIIFVDDFIGTGEQAVRIISPYLEKYEWLSRASIYYCALIGFRDGINAVKSNLSGKLVDVIVAHELDEKDKAFSDKNPFWKSERARVEAKQWAEEIGRQVITGMPNYDPERDKLGWDGCQALVAFHYNIPNNTLPIFWGTGERNGNRWIPLQERYD